MRKFYSTLTVREKIQKASGRKFGGAGQKRQAYKKRGENILIPRIKMESIAKIFNISPISFPSPSLEEWQELGLNRENYYDYQLSGAEKTLEILEDKQFAYIKMGTGMGKTRFALAVAALLGGKIFIVVPTDAIRIQWMKEIAELFPHIVAKEYRNANADKEEDVQIYVGINNTIRNKPDGFFCDCNLVILDEAHELHSPSNVKILWLIQSANYALGLSATPEDRADGMDRTIFHFLGRPIDLNIDSVTNFRGVVRLINYAGHPDYCGAPVLSDLGTVMATKTIEKFIADPARINLIIDEIKYLYHLDETTNDEFTQSVDLGLSKGAKHGIFVFAEHREFLTELRDKLLESFDYSEIDAPELEVLRGGASKKEVANAYKSRIVLTTYGYSRRGISIVDMTALILATPRRSGMNQILGRITRRGSDERIMRIVVDICDVRSALKGQVYERKKVYEEKNYDIFHIKRCSI